MPPTGYLTASGIEACLTYIASTFPSITQLITLPENSVEGRTSRAIKIAAGSGSGRDGVLFIGGVHARELINPDLLVNLALRLCNSYTSNNDIVYGGKTWTAGVIKLLIDTLDIFIFPLVNPDGRVWVQSPSGYAMWRKNRRVNAGSSCMGVDINRNYDFLWSSGIGTSASACSDVFRGPGAFSEPETRNVRWLMDTYSNIECFADVHSYSQLVLYPWGDDDNQTTTPSQNFQNPAWNGLRGVLGSGYGEYISAAEQDRFITTGTLVRDAIADVRGRVYTVEEGSDLYPTSGTSEDYAYSRNFVDGSKRRIYGFTLETATEFQPPFSEALEVINEASSGLIQLLVSSMCALEGTKSVKLSAAELVAIRGFRERELFGRRVGRRWMEALERHTPELLELVDGDEALSSQAADLFLVASPLVERLISDEPLEISGEVADAAARLLESVAERSSPRLRSTLSVIRADLLQLRGKELSAGMRELEEIEEAKARTTQT